MYIDGGFESFRTQNLTDDDYYDDPPDIYFTIDHFRNPRTSTATTPWNITIYNKTDDIQYSWNETSPTAPTTRIYGTAIPEYFELTRESYRNGNVTNYEFLVQTTNYVSTGDLIYISLPDGASFSEDSTCVGRSNNLEATLDCTVSVDLSKILLRV